VERSASLKTEIKNDFFFRTLNAKEGEEETRSYLSVLSVCQINCNCIAKNVLVNLRRLLFGVGDLLDKGL
jgi:hypothetical protein